MKSIKIERKEDWKEFIKKEAKYSIPAECRGGICIDAGCNIGDFELNYGNRFDKYICFDVFQENVKIFEEKAPTMSQQEFEYYRNDLEQTRGKMMQDQQEVERSLMGREQELMLLMKNEVDSVLNMIKTENHLDFVFTYPLGSGLLYADDSYDITPLVTEKLNALRPTSNEE